MTESIRTKRRRIMSKQWTTAHTSQGLNTKPTQQSYVTATRAMEIRDIQVSIELP